MRNVSKILKKLNKNKKNGETCKTCGKDHIGVCLQGEKVCYNYSHKELILRNIEENMNEPLLELEHNFEECLIEDLGRELMECTQEIFGTNYSESRAVEEPPVEIPMMDDNVEDWMKLWKIERDLNNELQTSLGKMKKERNELKAQLAKIIDKGCSTSKKTSKKRKWNNTEESKTNEAKNKKITGSCKTCGKGHMGVCLKGKNVCYNCSQEGHFANNCPNSKKGICFNCGIHGHQAKNCPEKGGSGETGL